MLAPDRDAPAADLTRFVEGLVAEAAERIDRDAAFDETLYHAGAEAGLTRLLLTENHTLDLSGMRAVHESTEAISTHSPAVALQLSGTRLIAYLLTRYAPRRLVERWVPGLASGTAYGSFGITEPHAGTDVRGISTVARRGDGKWILDGEKCWIGYAPIADVAVVLAKVGTADRDADTVALVVDLSAPGVERLDGPALSGFRGMPNGILRFRGVEVPLEDRLEVEGFAGMMDGLNLARIEAGDR